ncbi:MAG: hypothetical protein KME49_14210 [Brasilonema octagenarum HA4186-MV1]|nr:hypothetical protein [Brasilonema octagenarum HA4186-MV1]
MSPALREGFQRQIPSEGDSPTVLDPPQVTGVPEGLVFICLATICH